VIESPLPRPIGRSLLPQLPDSDGTATGSDSSSGSSSGVSGGGGTGSSISGGSSPSGGGSSASGGTSSSGGGSSPSSSTTPATPDDSKTIHSTPSAGLIMALVSVTLLGAAFMFVMRRRRNKREPKIDKCHLIDNIIEFEYHLEENQTDSSLTTSMSDPEVSAYLDIELAPPSRRPFAAIKKAAERAQQLKINAEVARLAQVVRRVKEARKAEEARLAQLEDARIFAEQERAERLEAEQVTRLEQNWISIGGGIYVAPEDEEKQEAENDQTQKDISLEGEELNEQNNDESVTNWKSIGGGIYVTEQVQLLQPMGDTIDLDQGEEELEEQKADDTPSSNAGKEDTKRVPQSSICSICFKESFGEMKACQCGNPECKRRAHMICVNRINPGPSVAHPGTPAPRLPTVLCAGPLATVR